MPKRFDVFLSHNSMDKPAVRELAEALRARGLKVWLDEQCLLPGDRWQEVLEEIIRTCRTAAVLVGPSGLGPWQEPEMRGCLDEFVRRKAPVLPVLLPGAPAKPELPLFLSAFTWSDLRDGLTPEAIDRLADGIRRRPPGKPRPDPLDLYRSWAGERYNGLSLIGLGGGDLGRLGFEEVYVPLRIVRRREVMEGLGTLEKRPDPPRDELGIESLFSTPDASSPHALLLGDPGSGKTTGLLKLLHLCLRSGGPRSLGVPDETLPVFLRLRRFTPEDLDRPFEDFLQRELERELGEVAKGKIPADLGARLWQHGPLLLLLDGPRRDRRGEPPCPRLPAPRQLGAVLAPRGRQVSARLVLDWLHRDAGVLTDFGDHRYGLLHLGLQEYLAACHIARQGSSLLEEVCAHAGEEWWQEVFLLLAGLPGHGVFGPLLEGLLHSGALLGQADLIRACLEEAAEPDLTPFLAVLAPAEPPERQATVLRLLRGRNDPRLEAPVRALLGSPHPDVQALARQMAGSFAAQPAGPGAGEGSVFVLHAPEESTAAVALAQALRSRGWRALAAAEDSSWRSDPELLVQEARGVVVLIAGGKSPWDERELLSVLKLFAGSSCALVVAELSAEAGARALPRFLSTACWVDLRGGLTQSGLEALDHALTGVSAPAGKSAPPVEPVAGEATDGLLVESLTGLRFVQIPGGRFQIGSQGLPYAEPIHPVRITPFWLGETPVTNAQYAVYLEKTGATEPAYWRDRRFSSPDQPVVGVSWEDSQAFCRWLGETWGHQVMLPSEAQWEFAARGADGRKYPWGNEEPDASRACFGLDRQKDQPAAVGSYPAGRGPFGTLDQAGNVWEWCRDAWDKDAYGKRAANAEEALDPFVEGDETSDRVLRGSGWVHSAVLLRAAFRYRDPARRRHDSIGFRVAAAPASASPPSPLPSPSLPPGEGRRRPKT